MAPAAQNSIKGTIRTEVGKGSARRARRAGLVPAVLYGHGIESVPLDLPGHEVFLLIKDSTNAVVEVTYGSKKQLALVRQIQRHPVRRDILHLDLLAVSAKERVEVEVPVAIIGEPVPGTQLQQEEFAVVVSAPAISIPDSLEISVEGLEEGAVVRVRDIVLPEGVEVDEELADRDVVSIVAITEVAEEPEELAEAESEVEAATEDN